MCIRDRLGGLARTTSDVAILLAGAGFDVVLVETVGAGQSETEIARLAQTTIVVEAPGLGDDIQAMKAGILEIADVLVVNKADDPRAANAARALQAMLDLGDQRPAAMHHGRLVEVTVPQVQEGTGWRVPIRQTNALTGEGVPALIETLDAHRAHLDASGELAFREQARAATELEMLLQETLLSRLIATIGVERVSAAVAHIANRDMTPHAAADSLLADWLRSP
ncbi:MAG: methylmalonyl Co-A mutase-associated GTPase MeaB, partial [Chloroflexi bacterium]|nr:methylmalonyl Co-A mutase-associated GTPase MeaB [Chloroflexota bacterium]